MRRFSAGLSSGLTLALLPLLLVAEEGAVAPTKVQRPLPYESNDRTLGVVTCASSLCHGSIVEWRDSNVLQNEYVTWLRVDKHAGAARLLLNAQSKRIAANLNLPEPPEKSKVCLDCHAHNPRTNRLGARAKVDDGIQCEACHGPAERWVASHTAPGATHAENVTRGLYPTDRPADRARLCLSCHFGNEDRLVTHRIMGAGHPRLSFELETFSSIGPAHFRVDADYEARKGPWNGAKVWAIGQALAVAETGKLLTSPGRGRDGIFPELVLFDCHACHHPMSQKRWTAATGFGASPGPGLPRINDSNMLMLRAILRQVDPALAEQFSAQVLRLHRAAAGVGDLGLVAAEISRTAERSADRIEAHLWDDATLRGVALALVDEGLSGYYRDYAGAEQSFMAIGSVLNYMKARGHVKDVGALNRGLASLREPLTSDEAYAEGAFLSRLKAFRPLVVALPPGK
jgi:hypothetical protein